MRKRTPKVVWLPPTNANSIGQQGRGIWNTALITIATGTNEGEAASGEFPVVIDAESDPLAPTTSLADVVSSGYRLRRIVGKFWFIIFGAEGGSEAVAVDAGFIIRRIDPVTGNSFALATASQDNIGPGFLENATDPWIWRKSWFAGNADNPLFAAERIPFHNGSSLSAVDSGHIDQKTARIVGAEERLFLDVTCTNLLSAGAATASATNVQLFWQTRILGSMRTQQGNRRNASR